ncbi:FUSC family protein, partial [Streptomyces erythrogriseus]|uniref:FUSC family protein n=1 Tax=Streptomyces erythrogriseus TaxID=284027 RepID=UPI0031FA1BFA
ETARGGGEGGAGARSAAYAAVHAAWQTLLAVRNRPSTTRRTLERLVIRAEVALAAPADADPARLRSWARAVRGTGRVPRTGDPRREEDGLRPDGVGSRPDGAGQCRTEGGARLDDDSLRRDGDLLRERDELVGVAAERAVAPRPLRSRLGPLAPVAVRSALGCALAGYASLALGAERPYWALVTAASLYQANITLTWSRAVQRVVGNLVGVLLFAAVAPVAQLGPLALVLCILACNFGAEALIGRNYWLGSVCVTPLALLVTELPGYQPTGELVTGRVVDTLVGALVGFVAAVAVTNRRAGRRVERALITVDRAREHAARVAADPSSSPAALVAARRGLAAAVVDLRATADAAAGEWWQRALPLERVVLAEQAAHRTLAATVRRRGLPPDPGTTSTYTYTEGASP